MKVIYDPAADIAYLNIRKVAVGNTFEPKKVFPGIICDFDSARNLLGIKFVNPANAIFWTLMLVLIPVMLVSSGVTQMIFTGLAITLAVIYACLRLSVLSGR